MVTYGSFRASAKKLIQAAVNAANGRESPPPDLQLAFLCGTQLLPDNGAVLDQDYGLMMRMRYLYNVYRTIQYMRGLHGNDINTGLSTSQRLLLGDLVNIGISIGGIGG